MKTKELCMGIVCVCRRTGDLCKVVGFKSGIQNRVVYSVDGVKSDCTTNTFLKHWDKVNAKS